MVTMEAYRKSPPGYSVDPPPTPNDHLFSQTGAYNLSQNLHRKLQPNGTRYNGGLY